MNLDVAYLESEAFVDLLAYVMIGSGILAAVLLLGGFKAYYGRYPTTKFGPLLNPNFAWFLQEVPSFIVPIALLASAPAKFFHSIQNVTCLAVFLFHYFNRALVYPWRIKGGKPTPLIVMLMAFSFCVWNGYMQVRVVCQIFETTVCICICIHTFTFHTCAYAHSLQGLPIYDTCVKMFLM